MEIGVFDVAIIVAYLISLAVVAILAGRRVKDVGQYFLGGRRFGKLLMIAQSFGVSTHADMPVSLAGAVYSSGLSAIWYQWKNLFATPFYWIMAPVLRRVRRTTTAEAVEDRYGPGMGGLYIVFAFIYFTINIASILKGTAKVLHEIFGGSFGVNHIVLSLAVVFILYSFVGGLLASAWSDVIQGTMIISLSFMLIPLGWGVVGGLHGITQVLPASSLSLATPHEISLWLILMLTINGLVGIMAQPHIMAAVSTGKDEHACRVGFFHGTLVKRICTAGWAVVGLMVAVMVARGIFGVHSLNDPEDAFGFACRHLLVAPGLRGLLVTSMAGASLASCSALMIDSGALFTQGLYRTRLVPGKSERHYLWVGRISGLAIVVCAIVYALFLVERILYSFLLTETLASYIGISIVTGFVWHRANRWGAAASVVVALGVNFLFYYLMDRRLDYFDPNVFLASFLTGIVSLVVVSLLTPPEPEADIALFFKKLQISSDDARKGERLIQGRDADVADLLLDANRSSAGRGRQLLITNLMHLRRGAYGVGIWRAYREDLNGLLIGFGFSAGLVIGLWTLFRL